MAAPHPASSSDVEADATEQVDEVFKNSGIVWV